LISKQHGYYVLARDVCGSESPELFDTFQETVDYKRGSDWTSKRDHFGNWYDVCPDCAYEGWWD
jgi:hypothetical protein